MGDRCHPFSRPLPARLKEFCAAPACAKRSGEGRRNSFTLLELMAVILIIAILATLLFPVLLRVQNKGREKRAMMEIRNLEMALRSYRALYGYWPTQTNGAEDIGYYRDNAAVIDALTNSAAGKNPRREILLQVQQSALTNGSYRDPWRHPYVIVMDGDGDKKTRFDVADVILTNLSGVVTTNRLDFINDAAVGVMSWGGGDEPLNVSGAAYLTMDLVSWQRGSKTK